jgi:pimeloyl-ACP methyl ester carboxylesterase
MTDTGLAAPPLTSLDVAGTATSLRRAGAGAPLLFLHGAFFPTAWLPLHDALAAHADVTAPLHPGYAEGGPPAWLRGMDDLAIHYHDLLDALGLEAVDVVGYDLGGWIAAELAAFYPERVRSLTLVAAFGLRVPEAPVLEFLAADPQRVAEALFNGDPGPHAALLADPADIPSFVEAYGHNAVTARLIWERRYDARLERRLQRLQLPAHVIAATDDRVVPLAHGHRWAAALDGARLTELAGAAHASVLHEPEWLAATITSFIAELPAEVRP